MIKIAMDIRKTKYILPNLWTIASIFLGLYAIVQSALNSPKGFFNAGIAIIIAMFCDSMDGRVARMTKTETQFGVELDSLADIISFGVAPAILIYFWGMSDIFIGRFNLGMTLAFLFTACGAMRLARFNILSVLKGKHPGDFVGLPIPIAAGCVAVMIIAHHQTQIPFLTKAATLIVTVPVLSLLMVSTIRYRSFKHVKWDKKMRIFALSMLLLAVAAGTLTKPVFALVLLLLVYLISGPVEYIALMLFRAYHRIHPPESLQEATKIPGK